MVLLALINLRGVGESVKFNVVLTMVEVTALTIVIGVGFYVIAQGDGSFDRITTFENPDDKGLFLAVTAATSIAFFAMVGFEDSVNMVEETKEPERIFPRTLLTGLGIAVIIYMLVAISVVTVLTSEQIADAADGRALLEVVRIGAPDFPIDKVFPFLAVFAVANTALINMLMASRLLYGLAHQDVLPRALGKVSPNTRAPYAGIIFSTLLALGLIVYVANRAEDDVVDQPGQRHLAAAARRLHRRQHRLPGAAPRRPRVAVPLAGPHAGDRGGGLPRSSSAPGSTGRASSTRSPPCCWCIGVVLWAITWATNRGVRAQKTGFRDIEHLDESLTGPDPRPRESGPRAPPYA